MPGGTSNVAFTVWASHFACHYYCICPHAKHEAVIADIIRACGSVNAFVTSLHVVTLPSMPQAHFADVPPLSQMFPAVVRESDRHRQV
jgi:hypothetical protein